MVRLSGVLVAIVLTLVAVRSGAGEVNLANGESVAGTI